MMRASGRRAVRLHRRDVGRLFVENGAHRFDEGRPLKRMPAGHQLVQHRTEREDVGAMVGRLCPHLLRRHVTRRAEHHARGGPDVARRVHIRVGFSKFGKTKIENLDAIVCRDEDVFRLQIAVRDVAVVGCRET